MRRLTECDLCKICANHLLKSHAGYRYELYTKIEYKLVCLSFGDSPIRNDHRGQMNYIYSAI
jgi:hypothetical protein